MVKEVIYAAKLSEHALNPYQVPAYCPIGPLTFLEMARNNPRVVNLHAAYETDHDIVLILEL